MQGFDLAIASIVIACISIVVAAILAVLQLRNQNQTRQAQLFMELYDQFYSPEFHRRWMELVYLIKDEDLIDADGTPTFLKGEIENYVEITALCCFF
jgi:cytochrome oxidase Cu insertion factor (SCO1/SenC/PrrC family)